MTLEVLEVAGDVNGDDRGETRYELLPPCTHDSSMEELAKLIHKEL